MDELRLSEQVTNDIRNSILEAKGNELFFVAQVEDRKVTGVEVAARGNSVSVPAVTSKLRPGMVVLHNHPSGDLTPSGADITLASKLSADGVGFAITDNTAQRLYVVVEPDAGYADKAVALDELEEILAAGGSVNRNMYGYESRPQQVAMAERVAQVLHKGGQGIFEAATGTGKSLAYLVPVLIWALKNEKRVVVSTNTINLQEQLLYKDIPLLKKALPLPFKAVLVKGRGNYLCRRKLWEVCRSGEDLLEDGDLEPLQVLLKWEKTTRDGSLSDLNFTPRAELWEQLCSEGDTCLRSQCPLFRDCFFHRVRREALDAQLLVANHHLLFADIAMRSGGSDTGVLPRYHAVVFDEAHNIEQVATTWFGARVTRLGLVRLLGRLYGQRGAKAKGLLLLIERKLGANQQLSEQNFKQAVSKIHQELVPLIINAVAGINDYFTGMQSHVAGEDKKIRLDNSGEPWKSRLEEGREMVHRLDSLVDAMEGFIGHLERTGPGVFEELLPSVVELIAMSGRLQVQVGSLRDVLFGDGENTVRWLEAYNTHQGPAVSFHHAPLSVDGLLVDNIWQRIPATILTSATLSVAGDFGYLRRQLGLAEIMSVEEGIFPSPFDYSSQAMVGVATDIPEPEQPGFAGKIGPALLASVQATRGRALILFTSYSLLRSAYNYLQNNLDRQSINLLCQGEAPRTHLLDRFRTDTGSVLLATASFWEGIDVVGESLSSLIITRLPFSVPDDPVMAAKLERLKSQGRNPFYEYQLPQAVLKFKQGFGRLIRSRNDRGVVLVLDRRISTRRYGRIFLDSLPECTLMEEDLATLLGKQQEFIG